MLRLNLIDKTSRLVGERLSYVFLAAVVFTSYEVVMRYAFNAPTIWVHDIAIALSAIGFVFGGAYALQRQEHIRISILYAAMPRRVQRVLDVLCALLTVLFLAALTYAAVRLAVPSVRLMETSGRAWDVPIPALLKTVLALGAALMLLQALAQLIRVFRNH